MSSGGSPGPAYRDSRTTPAFLVRRSTSSTAIARHPNCEKLRQASPANVDLHLGQAAFRSQDRAGHGQHPPAPCPSNTRSQVMRSADTSPAAARVQIELLRRASVAQRAALARSLSRTTLQLARRAVERANPDADAQEVAVRFVAICYGRELAESLRQYLRSAPR